VRPQEIRPRSRMVSRECGRCASQYIRCERLVVTKSSEQHCLDFPDEPLRRIGHCVFLGVACQAEFDSPKRPPPKDWTPKQTRIKTVSVPRKRPYRKPKAPRRQKLVPCKELGDDTHCKSHYKRCEWLMGRSKFHCPWLGCKTDLLARDKYGPIRPQECLDEPAGAKEEK
jgi:hypothetical protein